MDLPRNNRIAKPLKDLQAGLKALYGEQAPDVVLYGSQVRGNANRESDIDVLLVYDQPISPGVEIRRVSPILARINLSHQALISVFPAFRGEYLSSSEVFWQNVRKEGILVHG